MRGEYKGPRPSAAMSFQVRNRTVLQSVMKPYNASGQTTLIFGESQKSGSQKGPPLTTRRAFLRYGNGSCFPACELLLARLTASRVHLSIFTWSAGIICSHPCASFSHDAR